MEPPVKRQRVGEKAFYSSHADDSELDQLPSLGDVRLRFKSRLEAIFDKYDKDFTGVGDEIDIRTGEIVVNNGHLEDLPYEANAEGPRWDEEDEEASSSDEDMTGFYDDLQKTTPRKWQSIPPVATKIYQDNAAVAEELRASRRQDQPMTSLHNKVLESLRTSTELLQRLRNRPATDVNIEIQATDSRWRIPQLPEELSRSKNFKARSTNRREMEDFARPNSADDRLYRGTLLETKYLRNRCHRSTNWTDEEIERLIYFRHKTKVSFPNLARYFPGRSVGSITTFWSRLNRSDSSISVGHPEATTIGRSGDVNPQWQFPIATSGRIRNVAPTREANGSGVLNSCSEEEDAERRTLEDALQSRLPLIAQDFHAPRHENVPTAKPDRLDFSHVKGFENSTPLPNNFADERISLDESWAPNVFEDHQQLRSNFDRHFSSTYSFQEKKGLSPAHVPSTKFNVGVDSAHAISQRGSQFSNSRKARRLYNSSVAQKSSIMSGSLSPTLKQSYLKEPEVSAMLSDTSTRRTRLAFRDGLIQRNALATSYEQRRGAGTSVILNPNQAIESTPRIHSTEGLPPIPSRHLEQDSVDGGRSSRSLLTSPDTNMSSRSSQSRQSTVSQELIFQQRRKNQVPRYGELQDCNQDSTTAAHDAAGLKTLQLSTTRNAGLLEPWDDWEQNSTAKAPIRITKEHPTQSRVTSNPNFVASTTIQAPQPYSSDTFEELPVTAARVVPYGPHDDPMEEIEKASEENFEHSKFHPTGPYDTFIQELLEASKLYSDDVETRLPNESYSESMEEPVIDPFLEQASNVLELPNALEIAQMDDSDAAIPQRLTSPSDLVQEQTWQAVVSSSPSPSESNNRQGSSGKLMPGLSSEKERKISPEAIECADLPEKRLEGLTADHSRSNSYPKLASIARSRPVSREKIGEFSSQQYTTEKASVSLAVLESLDQPENDSHQEHKSSDISGTMTPTIVNVLQSASEPEEKPEEKSTPRAVPMMVASSAVLGSNPLSRSGQRSQKKKASGRSLDSSPRISPTIASELRSRPETKLLHTPSKSKMATRRVESGREVPSSSQVSLLSLSSLLSNDSEDELSFTTTTMVSKSNARKRSTQKDVARPPCSGGNGNPCSRAYCLQCASSESDVSF